MTEIPEGRICTRCGNWLPMQKFNKQKSGKYGRAPACRDCRVILRRESDARVAQRAADRAAHLRHLAGLVNWRQPQNDDDNNSPRIKPENIWANVKYRRESFMGEHICATCGSRWWTEGRRDECCPPELLAESRRIMERRYGMSLETYRRLNPAEPPGAHGRGSIAAGIPAGEFKYK